MYRFLMSFGGGVYAAETGQKPASVNYKFHLNYARENCCAASAPAVAFMPPKRGKNPRPQIISFI